MMGMTCGSMMCVRSGRLVVPAPEPAGDALSRFVTRGEGLTNGDPLPVVAGHEKARIVPFQPHHEVLYAAIPELVLWHGLGPENVLHIGWCTDHPQGHTQVVQDD